MKKATTIIFGLIGLIFGLVFTSIKIDASQIIDDIDTPIAELNGHTLREVFDDTSLFDSLQLVMNGDFSAGTPYPFSNSAGAMSVVNNQVVFGGYNTTFQFIQNIDMNGKYYLSFDLVVSNNDPKIGWYDGIDYKIPLQLRNQGFNSFIIDSVGNSIGITIAAGTGANSIFDNFYAFDISALIANKQYSPLYNTTFDLLTDAQIKAQMDLFVSKPYLFIDYETLGIDNLTVEQMDYYYQLYYIFNQGYKKGYDAGYQIGYLKGYQDAHDSSLKLYWGYQNGETLMVKSPYLDYPENINVFLKRFLVDYAYDKKAIITLDTLYVDFVYNKYAVSYSGWLDTITYERPSYDDETDVFTVLTTFYYKGEIQLEFITEQYDNYFNLDVTGSLIKQFGDIKYQEGKTVGYNNGYKEGVATAYFDGFGGFINPDTNEPYDETTSFPYGQGYDKGFDDGMQSTESGGLWGVLFSALMAPFQVLGIELLPGVTIGMIVAVPLVFGLLAWILSAGKSKK